MGGKIEYTQKPVLNLPEALPEVVAEPSTAQKLLEEMADYIGYWPLLVCAVFGAICLKFYWQPIKRSTKRRLKRWILTEDESTGVNTKSG